MVLNETVIINRSITKIAIIKLVHIASSYLPEIYLRINKKIVSAKSLLSLLKLNLESGNIISVIVEGNNKKQVNMAMKAIIAFLSKRI